MSPFHSKTGFVAWVFLVEAVLGFLHLGEFSVRFAYDVFAWLQTNFLATFFIGLGLLVLHVKWPQTQPRIPAWLRFRTVHDRLHAIEAEHIPELLNGAETLGGRVGELEVKVSSIRADLDEAISTIGRLLGLHEGATASFDRLWKDFNASRIDDMRNWVEINGRIDSLAAKLPLSCRYLWQLDQLRAEAQKAIDMFCLLEEKYPGHEVVTHLFSLSWRPVVGTTPQDQAILDGVAWFAFMREHASHCMAFCLFWADNVAIDLMPPQLHVNIAYSRDNLTAAESKALLQSHLDGLEVRWRDYAAFFWPAASANRATS